MDRARELFAFFAIYVIWGSTFLAIRFAVETIPPLLTAGLRHLAAAVLIYLVFVWMRGTRVRISAAEWRASVVVAALFFLVGHGTLHWAEQTVPSGIAALLWATEPVCIALLMRGHNGTGAPLRTAAGLGAGLLGVGLLVPWGSMALGSSELWGSGVMLLGVFAWAVGVRYAATAPLPHDPFVRTATMLLCGAALLLVTSAVSGEVAHVDLRAVTTRSWLGLGYLIVFGSVVAFSAYIWLLQRRDATLVATHTFVNPVVAVLLGWLAAGEVVTIEIVGATGLILLALVLLRSRDDGAGARGLASGIEATPAAAKGAV